MNPAWIVLPALLYLLGAIVTFAGCLAYWQREYPTIAEQDYRSDVLLSILFSLLPPLWAVGFIETRGYRHGFMFPKASDPASIQSCEPQRETTERRKGLKKKGGK